MQDLIRRTMELWQNATRDGATPEEVTRCLAVVPELCAALEQAPTSGSGTHGSGSGSTDRESLERMGRYFGHEVRNRVHVVELSLERAALLSGDPRVRSALEPVRRSLRHLEAMAEDLRSAGAPSGQPRACEPRLPLRTVIQDLLATHGGVAEERGIRLQTVGELPEVEVDAARLELILGNLLTNALRHADPDKRERWIRIEARHLPADGAGGSADGHGHLRCSVVDNGVGIPSERRPGLFEEPRSGDGDAPPRRGMGLAIVRQAVERDGGRVWAETEERVGTGVYFTCPLTSGVAGEARPEARLEPPSEARG